MRVAVQEALVPGAVIGVYTLLEPIGHGARGPLFRAEQADSGRTVALRVFSEPDLAPHELARFRYEAQALCSLRHDAIAQLYEAGIHTVEEVTEAHALPWMASEYVPGGSSLTEHAARTGMGREQRLRLFLEVCDAVQHGHQRGVVHRELSAAKILVGSDGRPKVLDFGVSRTFEAGGDVRSDIAALGAVLADLVGAGPLPGDLEAILRSARHEDVSRRYASANALAADLRRFLEHRPIEARDAGPIHPMRLFARRHPFVVGAVALLVLLSLATAAVGVAYGVRAQREAAALREELDALRSP